MHYIGIVGAGNIARLHAQAIQQLPNATLVGFCDNGSGRARKLANEFQVKGFADVDRMLNDAGITIVLLATPSGLHAEATIAAAKARKHVLCEKPLEITGERIEQMVAAHEAAGTRLGCIFNYRYEDSVNAIRQALDTRRLGRITHASVQVPWWRDPEYYAGNWRGTLELDGGGALMNQSIHMIDLLQYLLGPVFSLFAYTATQVHNIEAEDTAVAVLHMASGALATVYGSTASYPGQARDMLITGTRGTIRQTNGEITVWQFADEQPIDAEIRANIAQPSDAKGASNPMSIAHLPHQRNIAAFLEAVKSGAPFEIEGKEARKAVEIITAIYRSARTGMEIRL
ncbi:MAG: Gfo/Idh/MocA family oxidoreductase [Bacteroidota bacterium]